MKSKNQIKGMLPYILMVLPAVIIFVVFFIIPLLSTAKSSFFKWTNYSPEITFCGLENYQRLMDNKTLFQGIENTLKYAFFTVFLQSVIALPVSVALNSKLKGKNIFRAIYFCPAVFSTLVVGYLWKYLLSTSDYGFINQLIIALGFEKVNFLGNGDIALAAIILIEVWQWFGWAMVIYLGNLQSISEDLYEAASIDGANGWDKFWHIIVPGLAPSIKVNLVTGMISGLKVFDIIISTTNGGPAHQTETILTLMFQKFSDGNYGYASAFGMVFLVVSMLLASVLLGIFNKWERSLGQ